ncbi:MAG: hypothetical protein ACFFAE_10820, partial [Candidatus Hodarchaeota archaeon]
ENARTHRTYYINGKPKLFQIGSKTHILSRADNEYARFGLGNARIFYHPSPNLELVFDHEGTSSPLSATNFKMNGIPVELNLSWTGGYQTGDVPGFQVVYIVPNQASEIKSGEIVTFSCTINTETTVISNFGILLNWSPDENIRPFWVPLWEDDVVFEAPTTTTVPTTSKTTTETKPSKSIDTSGFSIIFTFLSVLTVLISRHKRKNF